MQLKFCLKNCHEKKKKMCENYNSKHFQLLSQQLTIKINKKNIKFFSFNFIFSDLSSRSRHKIQ